MSQENVEIVRAAVDAYNRGEARGVWIWTIRDGSIVRACLHQELQEAVEAAGLD